MTSSSPTSSDLRMFAFQGHRMAYSTLKELLTSTELALFFGKVYNLNFQELSELIRLLFGRTVLDALSEGGHSTDLQDYLVDTVPEDVMLQARVQFAEQPVPSGLLPEMWAMAEIKIADSIREVAETLVDVFDHMDGMEGHMAFTHLADFNVQYNTIGTFDAVIKHHHGAPNLLILDDSGSMSERTVREIISDVVGLAWKANASLALVSNSCRVWEPGGYDVASVLAQAEYGGTYYETLVPLLQRDWGTVITIADYDSSRDAKRAIAEKAKGRIGEVLDISLVNRPSFLAESVGQLAQSVKPLLVKN